jgi:hypothetical protein
MATKQEMVQFAEKIERIVQELKVNYIDAIILYCERSGLEVEVAGTLVNNSLKNKIRKDALDLHLLAKSGRLPF